MATRVDDEGTPMLTERQVKALCALSYVWPLPTGYINSRLGIPARDVLPLVDQGFARILEPGAERDSAEAFGPFVVLTLDGAKAREAEIDWISKHRPNEGWRKRLLRFVGREQ